MPENLEDAYSKVMNLVKRLLELQSLLWDRALSAVSGHPLRHLVYQFQEHRESRDNIGIYQLTEVTQELADQVATAEEKADPVFRHALAKHPLESLAKSVVYDLKLNSSQIEALLAFHRLKSAMLRRYVPVTWFTAAFAVGALVGKTIPKEAFEAVDKEAWYGEFQLIVSGFLLVALYLIASAVAPMWLRTRKRAQEYEVLELVLQNASAIASFDEAQAAPPPPVGTIQPTPSDSIGQP